MKQEKNTVDKTHLQDLFADNNMHLREIKSSLLIAQRAMTNEYDAADVTKEDVVNNLELILDKLALIIKNYDEIYEWCSKI